MAKKGLIRDFSDEKKSELKSIIRNLDQNNKEFNGYMQDFFQDNIASLSRLFGYNIENHLDDLNAYHTEILDMKNTGVEKIDEIFNAVKEVDSNYKEKVTKSRKKIEEFRSTLGKLGGVLSAPLNSYSSSAVFPLAREEFSFESGEMELYVKAANVEELLKNGLITEQEAQYYREINARINSYYDKLCSYDPESKKYTYNWDNIKELLNKDKLDISNAEYVALIKIMDSFATGNQKDALDLDNYNKFLSLMFINPKLEYEPFNNRPDRTYKYELSPVIQELCGKYGSYYSEELSSGKYLSDDFALHTFNLNLLTTLCNYNTEVTFELPDKSPEKSVSISKFLTDSEDIGRKMFDYSLNVNDSKYNFSNTCSGGRLSSIITQDKTEYLIGTQSDGIEDFVINNVAVAAGFAGPVGAYGSAAFCVGSGIKSLIETTYADMRIDNMKDSGKLGLTLEALGVYGSITIVEGKVYVNNPAINMEDLELKLATYEIATGDSSLSIDKVRNYLNGMNDSSGRPLSFTKYCAEYHSELEEYIDGFDDKFKTCHDNGMFSEYGTNNFQSLTMEQKKEVIPELINQIKNSSIG